ncbi:MAG: helix-turn-helix transcriptional regulator [Actinobacteria bacterium]|nr:MAG: helix-turn-helix transcriptional regulator [Actinomycetota bacterium]
MLGRTYEDQNCSAARALEIVGERWSLLIIRDALFAGITRFADFQRRLSVAPNVLATRLDSFVEHGLMERRQYSQHPEHYEYVLTDQGRDLQPVILALSRWGDRWVAPEGPPVLYVHSACDSRVEQLIHCSTCGEVSDPADIGTRPGPGAS